MVDVYIAGDTGPSGFGVATRGVVRHLLDREDLNINLRTHDVGFSRTGADAGRMFPDTRFKEYLLRNDIVNEPFLIDDPRETAKRDTDGLLEALDTDVDEELMVRQFDGDPDVWMAFGGTGFAQHAPQDDDIYTILSTDFNLDIVPDRVVDREKLSDLMELIQSPLTSTDNEFLREELGVDNEKQLEEFLLDATDKEVGQTFNHENEMVLARIKDIAENIETSSGWKENLDLVDEVWVPAEWVKDAIVKRFPEYEDKVVAMPYGVPMNYEPGIYDHENCAYGVHTQQPNAQEHPCLADDTFTFLVVSRFYHIKGLYKMVRAYLEAFTDRDDVRMYVKTTSNQQFDFNAEAVLNQFVQQTQYPDPPEIGVGVDPMDTQHMYDLLGRANCFVQASRAECFGIAQFQAAYCRTPVIYTNWSAQRELIDEDHDGFFPLNEYTEERPEPETELLMFQGPDNYSVDSNWATPDVEALADLMRQVYELDEEESIRHSLSARQYVEENFDWSDRIEPRVGRILKGAGVEEVAA